jgi:hypothetical protein
MHSFKGVANEEDKICNNSTAVSEPNPLDSPEKQFEEFKKVYFTAFVLSVEKKRLITAFHETLSHVLKAEVRLLFRRIP